MVSCICEGSIISSVIEIVTKATVVLRNLTSILALCSDVCGSLLCTVLFYGQDEQTHVQCSRQIVSSETIHASV
jgi:hypothetical protein